MRFCKLFILIMLITSCKTHKTEQNIQLKELTKLSIGANIKESTIFNLDIFDTIIYHTFEDTAHTNDYKKPKSTIITRHLKAKKKEMKEAQSDKKKEELKESQSDKLKEAPSDNKKGKKDKKKQMKKSSKKSSIIPYSIVIIFLILLAYIKIKH